MTETSSEIKIIGLDSFQAEILRRKKEEEIRDEAAHFTEIKVSELTEDDREMFRQTNNGTLLFELDVFDAYRDRVCSGDNKSRIHFAAYLGNLLAVKQLQKK